MSLVKKRRNIFNRDDGRKCVGPTGFSETKESTLISLRLVDQVTVSTLQD